MHFLFGQIFNFSNTDYCRRNSENDNCWLTHDHKFFAIPDPDRLKLIKAVCFAADGNW
jgi:hypothetical protein